ncbi:MAG: hypothetical protein Q8L09_00400 [Candidatus Moranbacteria bacterium]|nr:hypothetical protein [Candidatus Moranbacteria bacterium]
MNLGRIIAYIVGIIFVGLILFLVLIPVLPKVDYRPVVNVDQFNSTLKKKFGTAVDFMPSEKRNYTYRYIYTSTNGERFRNPEITAYLKDHSAKNGYPGDAILKSFIGGAGSVILYIASDNAVPDPKYLRTE